MAATEASVAERAAEARVEKAALAQRESELHESEMALRQAELALQAAQQTHVDAVAQFERQAEAQQVHPLELCPESIPDSKPFLPRFKALYYACLPDRPITVD